LKKAERSVKTKKEQDVSENNLELFML